MQKKVQIISDGSQDLSPELSKEKDIEVSVIFLVNWIFVSWLFIS